MREFNKDLDLWMFNFEKLAKGDIVVRNEKYRQYRYCKFNGEPENGVFEIISLHYPRNSYWIGNATLRIMDCEDKSMIGETFFVNISQFRYAKDEELPKKIKELTLIGTITLMRLDTMFHLIVIILVIQSHRLLLVLKMDK